MKDLTDLHLNPTEYTLERIITSRCVSVGPCLLSFVLPEQTQLDGASQYKIFNGQSDQAPLIIQQSFTYPYAPIPLQVPAYFHRGLYVDLTLNIASITVQYLPLRD